MSKATVEVSRVKLWTMRFVYGITFFGLGSQAIYELLRPDEPLNTINGILFSFWAAYALIMGFGIFRPLIFFPLIILQLLYKSLWVAFVFLPMYSANRVDEQASSFVMICCVAIALDLLAIPWKYCKSKIF